MNLREELDKLVNKLEGNDIQSAFVLLSSKENTAFMAGGDKNDLRQELSQALVVLIENDPAVILALAQAVKEVQERQKKKHEKTPNPKPEVKMDDIEDIVKDALAKITKH